MQILRHVVIQALLYEQLLLAQPGTQSPAPSRRTSHGVTLPHIRQNLWLFPSSRNMDIPELWKCTAHCVNRGCAAVFNGRMEYYRDRQFGVPGWWFCDMGLGDLAATVALAEKLCGEGFWWRWFGEFWDATQGF